MTDEVLTKVVVDCSSGEVSYIPLTPEEIAEREALAAQAEQERIEREAAEAQKLADKQSAIEKLAALGLSDNEISALVG